MLISKNWLRDFVFLPDAFDAVDLAQRLSLSTVEVEKVLPQGAALDKIVVGKIEKISAHPNADKLKVCVVDVGDEKLSIVCGGSNIAEGLKVVVAKLGASVRWHGQGEPIIMEPAVIRGVESRGMICASDEVGLADRLLKKDEKEIVDLSQTDYAKVKVGTPLATALHLDDIIFDIDNKSLSNRPDLWGHYGMAREVAALTHKNIKALKHKNIKTDSEEIKISVSVKAPELCPRYMAVAVSGVAASASPDWLRNRLEAVGQRSINALVDVTNYVMLELGQPLHAFDGENLNSKISPSAKATEDRQNLKSIVVRRAEAGEKFVALDDKEYVLSPEMVVIADEEKSLAIAGVKGGKNSGVSATTTTIVFEAATFDAASIRRTSTALGLRTDSSARYEKSLDPNLPEIALRRVVELTQQIFPKCKIVSEVVDAANFSREPKILKFPWSFITERLGVDIEKKVAVDILERLGFGVQIKKGQAVVTVPSWRATKDISIPEDIVEEVVRIFGYANVPSSLPIFSTTPPLRNELRYLERDIKNILALETGLTEVYNYSFVAPEWLRQLGLDPALNWELDNPIAKDRPLIRTDLFPGLLENVRNNFHWSDTIRLFEIGRVYSLEQTGERTKQNSGELLPVQPIHLGIVIAEKNNNTPFFAAAHCLELLAKRLGYTLTLKPLHLTSEENVIAHPSRQAVVMIGDKSVGTVSELHPRLQQNLGLPSRVAVVELSLSELITCPRQPAGYEPVPEFPQVTRDIAFIVERKNTHHELQTALIAAHRLVKNAELFDLYEGESVGLGKKSVAYHITLGAPDRTLTTEEIDAAYAVLASMLEKKFGAVLRS